MLKSKFLVLILHYIFAILNKVTIIKIVNLVLVILSSEKSNISLCYLYGLGTSKRMHPSFLQDFPGGSDGKVSAYNAGDPGSIPGLGRSSGEGNGNPLQYSCLENSMDGGVS